MASAMAVNECGNSVQYATIYKSLQFISSIFPVVKVAWGLQQYLWLFALGGFGFGAGQLGGTMLIITILAFGGTTLFSLVTLAVEFEASKRALVGWNDQKIVN